MPNARFAKSSASFIIPNKFSIGLSKVFIVDAAITVEIGSFCARGDRDTAQTGVAARSDHVIHCNWSLSKDEQRFIVQT